METRIIAKSQIGNLSYSFLIVEVTDYHCQAHAHAFFFVRTHSLFYRPGIVGTGVCVHDLEWEKIKCQTLEREEIVVERWRMECKGSGTM